MEDFVRKSLLFDFYGELLTDHQKEIYGRYHAEDLSLGEIAQEYGISRQAIYDLLKRCDKQLENYEDRLHLLSRFSRQKGKVLEIKNLAQTQADDKLRQIYRLSQEILDEL